MTSYGWPMISTQKRERTENENETERDMDFCVMSRTFVSVHFCNTIDFGENRRQNTSFHRDKPGHCPEMSRSVSFLRLSDHRDKPFPLSREGRLSREERGFSEDVVSSPSVASVAPGHGFNITNLKECTS
jgi:hypothetical protein